MRAVVQSYCSRSLSRAAVLGVIAVGFSACSSESTRFGDSPFSNPFASQSAGPSEVTGSIPAAQPAPVGRVDSRPLQSAQPAPSGHAGTASAPPSRPAPAPAGWKWDGGTAVVVGPGESAGSVSRKYGVPVAAILQANGLSTPAAVQPGQRIVIPRYGPGVASAGAPAMRTAAKRPANAGTAVAAAPPGSGANVHVVAPGETLTSISRFYGTPLTELAAANNIAPHTMIKFGDRIVIPGRPARAAKSIQPAAASPKLQAPVRVQSSGTNQKVVAADPPPQTARIATPAGEASLEGSPATGAGGAPSFRWPVRGRVITGFGPKPNGQQNDGINLAVPEGTAVRAAEDGVVAYAGNELKGYGNLILIRHSNGFVTAYAHTTEIMVKRNDQVRRGQVIAKSGQTGTVTTPQLHFEIRKGSSPVDPMQYLSAGA